MLPGQGLVLLGKNHHGGLGSAPALHRKQSRPFCDGATPKHPHGDVQTFLTRVWDQLAGNSAPAGTADVPQLQSPRLGTWVRMFGGGRRGCVRGRQQDSLSSRGTGAERGLQQLPPALTVRTPPKEKKSAVSKGAGAELHL